MKEGVEPRKTWRKYDKLGILHEAKDWVMGVDVEQQLRVPEVVCISAYRQDISHQFIKIVT